MKEILFSDASYFSPGFSPGGEFTPGFPPGFPPGDYPVFLAFHMEDLPRVFPRVFPRGDGMLSASVRSSVRMFAFSWMCKILIKNSENFHFLSL